MKSLSSPAAPSAATGSRNLARFGAVTTVFLILLLIPLLRCCFSGIIANVLQDGPTTHPMSVLSPPTSRPTLSGLFDRRSSFGASRSKVLNAGSTPDRGAARRVWLTAAREMEMSDEHLEQLTKKICKDSAKETRREQAVLRHKSMIELHNTLNSQWNCSRIAPKEAEAKVTEAKGKVSKDAEDTSLSLLFDRRLLCYCRPAAYSGSGLRASVYPTVTATDSHCPGLNKAAASSAARPASGLSATAAAAAHGH